MSHVHCIYIDCEPPPPIAHGNATYNGTAVESSYATYTCDPGYDLIGSTNRKCLISSEWDGESPKCKSTTHRFLIERIHNY